ncbi:MAG: acetate--CoA ligase family protein [Rhodospirillaceae bacterium]|jgi:acetate---CoA ligase (ADP-forming)|nr:acetate--CoA ligase family protein [Rhodospirillaceae bacterium]MBT6511588.1 acetate--CoA ligase family protein [Rhodospirillaceae bacterium]
MNFTRNRIDHHLSPLLTPRSVAVVGASQREHSTGLTVIEKLDELGFDGPIYPVNPRYDEVAGHACYGSFDELPETVDLAVMAVGDTRIEEQLRLALEAGISAASIFGSCQVPDDSELALSQRLSAMLREARVPANGANCMGFCNYEARINVNSFPFDWQESGKITALAQSGSVFGALTGSRLGLNFVASIGSELSTTVADYMDYALELGTARVLTLFLETIRDGEAFEAALAKAADKDIPVVALKAGRSDLAARMAVSHSGALAGDDRAFDAVFRRHGVLRADTLDELVASSLMMERATGLGPGGLATIHDSGGEREMIADVADDLGVPFAAINDTTVAALADRLDYGLEPENPCDAFSSIVDHDGIARDCFTALMADPDTALGVFFLDLQQHNSYCTDLAQACLDAAQTTTKPVAMATNLCSVSYRELAAEFTKKHGIPVFDGTVPAIKAVAHALWWRDWKNRPQEEPPILDRTRQARWYARLAGGTPFDEAEGLALLADYGFSVPDHAVADTLADVLAAVERIGFPVVLKTAIPGIAHKSEVGGVKLNLTDAQAVREAYEDIAARLGTRVFVAPMLDAGVEMVLGVTRDPQFGALVLLGTGGVLVEILNDAAVLRPPVSVWEVRHVLAGLKAGKLLDGVRGAAPADRDALVDAVVKLSVLALELEGALAELDINPLLVRESGVVVLDALVVPGRT